MEVPQSTWEIDSCSGYTSVTPDSAPPDRSRTPDPPEFQRVEELVDGYLLALPPQIQSDRRRDLDPWFAFCAEFNIDPLLAEPRHVAGYAEYLSDVKDEAPVTVRGRLGALGLLRSRLAQGAVSGIPVPW